MNKMKKCKTCKHWIMPDKSKDEYFGAIELAAPRDITKEWDFITEVNKQRELFEYATQYCRNPKIKFYERPEKDGASVADGSEYMAVFITGEDYGCNLHENLLK